jgi:hypothetical protein
MSSALAEPDIETITPGGDGPEPLDGIGPNTYGISDLIYYRLPAASFSPRGTGTYTYSSGGYIYRTSGTGYYWATVTLPDGAFLHGARLYFYDDSASDISLWFYRYYGDSTDDSEQIAFAETAGTPGYANMVMDIDHTINNLSGAYVILLYLPNEDNTTRFKGVRLFYQLQVSPAPVSATFSDVPIGHWAHQYVEALSASGITEGYDDGTFRPGQPVLRGQMAAFLAKALGLHW